MTFFGRRGKMSLSCSALSCLLVVCLFGSFVFVGSSLVCAGSIVLNDDCINDHMVSAASCFSQVESS